MGLIRPESGVLYLKVPLSEPVVAVVVGEAQSYQVHWVRTRGWSREMPARCQLSDGNSCAICGEGKGWRARYIVPVRVEGELRLLELGKPQWGWLECMDVLGAWVGTRIRVARERPQKNAVITITTVGREHVSGESVFDAAGIAACEGQELYRAWLINEQRERDLVPIRGSLAESLGDQPGAVTRRSGSTPT